MARSLRANLGLMQCHSTLNRPIVYMGPANRAERALPGVPGHLYTAGKQRSLPQVLRGQERTLRIQTQR